MHSHIIRWKGCDLRSRSPVPNRCTIAFPVRSGSRTEKKPMEPPTWSRSGENDSQTAREDDKLKLKNEKRSKKSRVNKSAEVRMVEISIITGGEGRN